MEIEKAFSLALKEERQKLGLTQETFAEKTGLSIRYISRLECGNQLPNFKYLHKLSQALDMKISQFMSIVEEKQLSNEQEPEYMNT